MTVDEAFILGIGEELSKVAFFAGPPDVGPTLMNVLGNAYNSASNAIHDGMKGVGRDLASGAMDEVKDTVGKNIGDTLKNPWVLGGGMGLLGGLGMTLLSRKKQNQGTVVNNYYGNSGPSPQYGGGRPFAFQKGDNMLTQ